jgi:hypothetical protein
MLSDVSMVRSAHNIPKQLLDTYRQKQPFRISIGKTKWFWYEPENYNSAYNLREILKDEIVFEFDSTKYEKDLGKKWEVMTKEERDVFRDISYEAINFTAINLYKAGYSFSIWEHKGKSPHLHIQDLPISHFEKDKLRKFKKFFINKYCPEEYLPYVDYSLCGVHLVAIEWTNHWKGCYDVKRLLSEFNPKEAIQ